MVEQYMFKKIARPELQERLTGSSTNIDVKER
jgi:hypothetical protein